MLLSGLFVFVSCVVFVCACFIVLCVKYVRWCRMVFCVLFVLCSCVS